MSVPKEMFFEGIVSPEYDNKLLLDFLSKRFTYHSQKEWEDKILEGLIVVNGNEANLGTIVFKNDKIGYWVKNYSEPEVPANFKILFEDEEFLLVTKPAGIPVHHTGKIFYNTFTAVIRRTLNLETATPMHRLDRDTGGIMLFAKNKDTSSRFQKNLDKILIQKFYIACVHGKFPNGIIPCDIPLKENPNAQIRMMMFYDKEGKSCSTLFKKLVYFEEDNLSVIDCELLTGRKHQIRAHLKELGYPIIGDKIYNHDGFFYKKMSSGHILTDKDYFTLESHYQMLYAYKVKLKLPYWREAKFFVDFNFENEMKDKLKVLDFTTLDFLQN